LFFFFIKKNLKIQFSDSLSLYHGRKLLLFDADANGLYRNSLRCL